MALCCKKNHTLSSGDERVITHVKDGNEWWWVTQPLSVCVLSTTGGSIQCYSFDLINLISVNNCRYDTISFNSWM